MICNAFEGYRWTPDEEEFIASLMRGVVARERRRPPQQQCSRPTVCDDRLRAVREQVLALLAHRPMTQAELRDMTGTDRRSMNSAIAIMSRAGEVRGVHPRGYDKGAVWHLAGDGE